MNRFYRATCALISAAVLGLPGPLATAADRGDVRTGDDEWRFKHVGSSTVTGTAAYGGVTITFNVTITT